MEELTCKEDKIIDKLPSVMTVDDLAIMCEKEGVTVQAICKALAEGLRSDLPVKYDNSKVRYGEGEPDMYARHKYMSSALEVLQLIKKDVATVGVVEHQMASGDIERLEVLIKGIDKITDKLNSEGYHKGTTIDADFTAAREE